MRSTEAGHKVLVETHAGELSRFADDEYQAAGAEIVGSAHDVWAQRRDGREGEGAGRKRVRHSSAKAGALYLSASGATARLTEKLLAKKVTGIAYETIRDRRARCRC